MNDDQIQLAVVREMYNDPAVDPNYVDVAVEDGVVKLSGTVGDLISAERVADIAAGVRGVRSVVNDVQAAAPNREDAAIREDVERALRMYPATETFEIDVSVNNQEATLTGEVNSYAEKQLAGRMARSVRGVVDVNNNIEYDLVQDRPDEEVESDVAGRLRWDARVDGRLIEVEVRDRQVILSGNVGSAREKRLAEELAWVAGVDGVDARSLTVDYERQAEARKKFEKPDYTDDDVRRAVIRALKMDPRVEPSDLRIFVSYGTVTLTGTVQNLEAKRAAREDARNTAGVWRVKNYLKVRPGAGVVRPVSGRGAWAFTYVEDQTEAAREALRRDPVVDKHQIDVDGGGTNSAWLRLMGTVDTQREKERAIDVVSRLRGVVNVIDQIQVHQEWTPKPDRAIMEDVAGELWWSPFVDRDQVQIEVEDGVVTLIGVADNPQEKQAATENAYEGGAKSVRNRLKLKNID
jgi:osmotically-inducible protein OsmY